jgi:hypothetical protein
MPEATHNPPAHSNPAVARCCSAWDRTYQQARAKGKGELFAAMDAAQAYRQNLPALDSVDAVRDFIACVAQGMLLGAITGPDGARFLYAAQIASGVLRRQTQKHPAPVALGN